MHYQGKSFFGLRMLQDTENQTQRDFNGELGQVATYHQTMK